MIGVHHALFGLAAAGLAVGQFELAALGGGLGQRVKDFQVKDRFGAGAEGDGLLPVGQVQRDRVGQGGGHFLEGADEGPLEVGAAILLQGFFGYEQGKEFALGDLQGGKRADFLGVMIAACGRNRRPAAVRAGPA